MSRAEYMQRYRAAHPEYTERNREQARERKRRASGGRVPARCSGGKRSEKLAAEKKPETKAPKVKEPKRIDAVCVGLDGEGLTLPDGSTRYTLLAASTGDEIEDWERGLSTKRCLDFLWGLAQSNERRIFLWFGSSYDINCILRDVSRKQLTALWTTGKARYGKYEVTYIPGKIFNIAYKPGRRAQGRVFRSYDVFGFGQRSFVSTLEGWGILTRDMPEYSTITHMKTLRADFAGVEREQIREYNRLEVRLLAQYGERIRETHRDIGLELRSMHGAGATAMAMFKRHGVETPKKLGELAIPVIAAYYGGRIQLLRVGYVQPVYNYDLNSAYPAALAQLPAFNPVQYHETERFINGVWGLWHVRWSIDPDDLAPFPVRYRGQIWWPSEGSGWYWSPEVEAALAAYGSAIVVERGYVLHDSGERPFSFIRDYYTLRAEYKRKGDMREKVIKLGLNSMYGKLAQSALRADNTPYHSVIPPYLSYIHAGLITSITRARLFLAAMSAPESVILFATDGIYSTAPLEVKLDNTLGSWDGVTEPYERGFFLQPGVYAVKHADGWHYKTRGFLSSEIPFEDIMARWPVYEDVKVKTRRFITLGRALANQQRWPGDWCRWLDGYKLLQLPNHERAVVMADGRVLFLTPPVTESEPYTPRIPGLLDELTGDIGEIEYDELQTASEFLEV